MPRTRPRGKSPRYSGPVDITRIGVFLYLSLSVVTVAWSQADVSGEWSAVLSDANASDPQIGEYGGLPLSEGALRRARTWDPAIDSLPVWLCRPPMGMPLRLDALRLRILRQVDPSSSEVVALRVSIPRSLSLPIYLDGRPHPPAHERHTWGGFSTGEWLGDVLKVRTTHLKEGYFRHNGVPQSDRAHFTEFLIRRAFRDRDYLTWVVIAEDPVYLTEPLVRSSTYRREGLEEAVSSPCTVVKPSNGGTQRVPHILPRTAQEETPDGISAPPRVDGAATMYPEYRDRAQPATD